VDIGRAARLEPVRIDQIDGIIEHIPIEIEIVLGSKRIGAHPAADPGRVVAVAEVDEAGGIVPLFPAEAIVLELDLADTVTRNKGGAAEGEVLFVADDRALLVQLDLRRSEVVAELVANPRSGDVVGLATCTVNRPAMYQGNARNTVRYVRC